MLCRGKYRHIHANLGDKGHSRQRSGGEARNRADQFQLVRIGLGKPEDFGFDMLPVCIQLVDVQQAFLEFGCLFTGYRPVHGSLDFLNRMLAAPVDKRRYIKLLTRMLQNVLDNGA